MLDYQIENLSSERRSTPRGRVERLIFFHPETGQCTFEARVDHLKQPVSISCRIPWIYPGLEFRADAFEKSDFVLHAEKIELAYPRNERDLRRFLKSGAIKGIGPQLAKILAAAFSEDLVGVLEQTPEKLLGVSGIGKKRLAQIEYAWGQFKSRMELQEFLFRENLPLNWGEDLWAHYGAESVYNFKTKPYRTADECELDFVLVDAFALRSGFSMDSMERLRLGLHSLLDHHSRQGHCAYPESQVLGEAISLLEVSQDQIEQVLELEIVEGQLLTDTIRSVPCLYRKAIWDVEQEVLQRLLKFHGKAPPWGWFNSAKLLGWAQNILEIDLAPLQRKAIEVALSSPLTVITGGPGTGKTTLVQSLVTILQTQFARFALCSPTGRAAQNLGLATGMPASTIHRLLKLDTNTGQFIHNQENPLNYDLILIDEASMIDLPLMADLLRALSPQCALILVGDADQIPSVGIGNVLQSLISSELFEVVRLTEIYRQGHDSLIRKNAKRIHEGQMPWYHQDDRGDFHYIPVQGVAETKRVIKDLIGRVIPEKYGMMSLSDYQVLVPMNRGELGTFQLNFELQEERLQRLSSKHKYSTEDFGVNFQLGDKVMVTKNDYKKDVFNGDIGFIVFIDQQNKFLDIQFDERILRFEFQEMECLTLAYAISIHKAQGSEYRAVVVVVSKEHLPMAQRHLIYTAVTRGKEQVFLVAEPSALQEALQDVEPRWEKLTELLKCERGPL